MEREDNVSKQPQSTGEPDSTVTDTSVCPELHQKRDNTDLKNKASPEDSKKQCTNKAEATYHIAAELLGIEKPPKAPKSSREERRHKETCSSLVIAYILLALNLGLVILALVRISEGNGKVEVMRNDMFDVQSKLREIDLLKSEIEGVKNKVNNHIGQESHGDRGSGGDKGREEHGIGRKRHGDRGSGGDEKTNKDDRYRDDHTNYGI